MENSFDLKMDVQNITSETVVDGAAPLQAASVEMARLFPDGISRVLLVAPPDGDATMFDFATAKRGRYWNYPPYGLGVLATHLRKADINVRILNLNNLVLRAARAADGEENFSFTDVLEHALANEIGDFDPDLLGVTCMFAQTHRSALDVCHMVRNINADLAVALGGVHITNSFMEDNTRDALLDDLGVADLLFCYESDTSFRTFIAVANGRAEIADLSQVAFNGPRPRLHFADKSIPDGDTLDVIAAHDLMGTEELSENGKISGFYSLLPPGIKITTALANRGCRAQCTFCSVRNFNGLSVRRRSATSVVDEMIGLRDDFGIEHIMWLDDDFLYNRDRSIELFNEMIRRDVGMTWDCTNGVIAASCTEDVIGAASDSGWIGLTLGMESGNADMLKKIRKPGTVKNFLNAAEVFRNNEKINARVFLMIGFPDETYGQIMDTVSVAKEMGLDWYNVTILQPLPNTPIFDAMLDQGLIGDIDFSDIRYNSGQYGKHRKMAEASRDPLSADFKDAFSGVDMDAVPTREELDDIWAYMNFHLNFRRLFFEERPEKLAQQLAYVENIARLVAPDNAFATYFTGYLRYKTRGDIDPRIISQMEKILDQSSYWKERCEEFSLMPDDLKTLNFSHHQVQA